MRSTGNEQDAFYWRFSWPRRCMLPDSWRRCHVKVDITPKSSQWLLGYNARQSTGVHDPLYHRVVAMDDGHTQFYLVSTDVCLFSPGLYDEVAAETASGTFDGHHTKAILVERDPYPFQRPRYGPPGHVQVFLANRFNHELGP